MSTHQGWRNTTVCCKECMCTFLERGKIFASQMWTLVILSGRCVCWRRRWDASEAQWPAKCVCFAVCPLVGKCPQ